MKRLAILLMLPVLLVNLVATETRSAVDADRFVSLDGRFAISLPDKTSGTRRMSIPTPLHKAYGQLYEWHTHEGSFGIGYADAIGSFDNPEFAKQFFDGAKEGFSKLAEANGGKLGAVKQITLGKYPGIELRAELFSGSVIQRLYLVSRRIYETTVIVKNTQREHEGAALKVLDSFRLLSDSEITELSLKAGPGPLPQTPETPRAGSDAEDEGLRGRVKSVRTDIRYLVEPSFPEGTRSIVTTYNERGNKVRTETYDHKNNLSRIEVYGYLDGARVSTYKFIHREYSHPIAIGGGGDRPSTKPLDPRYHQKFEYKYDEQKRLIERTEYLSNGEASQRYVYKYEGNQKEETGYSGNGTLRWRDVHILDDKGNTIERTDFNYKNSPTGKTTFTYEYDSKGNWTKRTSSPNITNEQLRKLNTATVHQRTITYY